MIVVEAKTQKRFVRLTKKYNDGYDCWDVHREETCVNVDDGGYSNKKWYKSRGYKILTYKQWKSIFKGKDRGVCLRFNSKDVNEITTFLRYYKGENACEWIPYSGEYGDMYFFY
jgi:Zn/Cd-binding protein ZinT